MFGERFEQFEGKNHIKFYRARFLGMHQDGKLDILWNANPRAGLKAKFDDESFWNRENVQMPFSSHNLYIKKETGLAVQRYHLVQEAWTRKRSRSAQDIIEFINYYNHTHDLRFDFLEKFALKNEDAMKNFCKNTFFDMSHTVQSMELQFTKAIPLLKRGTQLSLSFSNKQVYTLLSAAFLVAFPGRYSQRLNNFTEYNNFPEFHFMSLLESKENYDLKSAKFSAIINYFDKMAKESDPKSVITYTRVVCNASVETVLDEKKEVKLTKISFSSKGVQESKENCLIVDFANKKVGGGTLGSGWGQEEILMLEYPELMLSFLFTENLLDNEALVVLGPQRYNVVSRTNNRFLSTPYDDKREQDLQYHIMNEFSIIDAINFEEPGKDPYSKRDIDRDLLKAMTGFAPTASPHHLTVSTGGWGTGIFKGDPEVKFCIQWIAASVHDREVIYSTVGMREPKKYQEFYTSVNKKGWKAVDLYKALTKSKLDRGKVFSAILKHK